LLIQKIFYNIIESGVGVWRNKIRVNLKNVDIIFTKLCRLEKLSSRSKLICMLHCFC